MKKTLIVLCAFALFIGFAQTEEEINGINFYPDAEKKDNLSEMGYNKLVANINRILLSTSQGATDGKHFVIYGKSNIVEESVTPTAPQMYKVVMEVQLISGDISEKRIYGSYTYSNLVGVNRNKNRAVIQALSKVRSNSKVQKFIKNSKTKIFEYYKNNCNFVITRASSLAEQGKYLEAIDKLDAVPSVSEDCFYMAQSKITDIAKMQMANLQEDNNVMKKTLKEVDSLDVLEATTEVNNPNESQENSEDYDFINSEKQKK